MLGTDVCSIVRIEQAWAEHGARFLGRLLTPTEREAMGTPTAEKLARRWALKEAVAKALGTGIGGDVGFQDIEVSHDTRGAPEVAVRGREGLRLHASVSDDAGVAMAVVLVERM